MFTRPIAPPWDEGSKNLAWEIAKNSTNENFNFSVLTPKESLGFLKNEKNITPQKIYSSTKFSLLEKIKLLRFLFDLKKNDFSIIHFLFTPRSLTSSFINSKIKKLNCKTVLTIATLNKKDYENPKKLKEILFSNKIVAQSDYTFKKLQEIGFDNTELIYPGIDLNYYRPKEKNLDLQKELGISQDDFVMLYAGEFTRLGAIDDIIQAMNILKIQCHPEFISGSSAKKTKILKQVQNDNNLSSPLGKEEPRGILKNSPPLYKGELERVIKNFKLIIACRIKSPADAQKKKQIESKIKELALENNIIILQKTVELLDYYNLSDLSIFPVQKMAGKFDVPLVLAESMACGKPILSSDLPVLKDFIKDNQTGYICPKANPKKLAEKIIEIMNNPENLETISQNALAYAKENFDIEKNVKKYDEIYREL